MNKRAFIYAYTHMNLGDDLFIKILCDRYPNTRFFIMCDKQSLKSFKNQPNLTAMPNIPLIDGGMRKIGSSWSFNSFLARQISYLCDATINIGGSIFQEKREWLSKFKSLKKRLKINKPYFILGSNFGPYKDSHYYEKYKSVFKNATDICFREKHSYELFRDLPNVRYASDIVFQYSCRTRDCQSKQIVISVIDLEGRDNLKKYKDIYQEKITQLSLYFSQKGFEVYLMGFCEKEGDKRAINEIYDNLKEEEKGNIKKYTYNGNMEEALKLMHESQYILATRFHSMILGWVLNKPVYPIIYSDKTTNVLNDIGFKDDFIKIQDISNLHADKVYNNLTKTEPLNIMQQVKSSEEQFKVLDKFLLKY